ncbi:glycosyltransferase N-terminal domain-containing protein, partial [Stenotrophomonas sp. BIIR7]|uniref:glycosyltransferase N-terminal domain-containing protein n=2 Tax=Stenotrophomonas TaxID=40323 RepID=UPI0027301E09
MRKSPVEWILRGLYSVVLYLLLPITVYHLVWRGFRVREYFQRWDERYASYPHSSAQPRVWLHAVSVGEVNAAAPLVNALRQLRPDIRWVITTITPTGSERVRALWGDAVDHVYLPYDVPGSVGRFLGHFKPSLALILETELWPNLLFGCRDRGIPVYILNARLS